MTRESWKSAGWGLLAASVLAALIVIGSRRLQHFDAALVGYTFATLFAVFGIVYRYAMWLQRPPTALYWRRGWQAFLHPRFLARNLAIWVPRTIGRIGLNDFIWKRRTARGAAHMLIMWGTFLAALITFPLVFGWIHFETVEGDFSRYRIFLFGFPSFDFATGGAMATLIFHGLIWASLLVIPGVMLAFRRRMRDRDAAATQNFGDDILPLVLLFAISITGLLLWVSYRFMHGYAYEFLAILHAATVIFTLLWLPFGKLFHLFQRPAQLGVAFYKDVGVRTEAARCRRCGDAFAPRMQVEDLIEVERRLGYRYSMPGTEAEHYQWICPRCRRGLLGVAQGRLWAGELRNVGTIDEAWLASIGGRENPDV